MLKTLIFDNAPAGGWEEWLVKCFKTLNSSWCILLGRMIGEILNKTLTLMMNDSPAGKQWWMLNTLIFYAAAPGKNGEMLNKTLILLLIFRYSFVFVLLLLLLPMLLGYPNYFTPAAMLAHVLFVLSLLHCISEYLWALRYTSIGCLVEEEEEEEEDMDERLYSNCIATICCGV